MRGFCMKRLLTLLSLMVLVLGLSNCASLGNANLLPRPKLSTSEMVKQEGGATVALMMYQDEKDTTQTTGYRPFCTGVWVDDTHILTADHCAKAEQEHQQDRLDSRKKQNEGEPGSLEEALRRLFGGMSGDAEPDKI